MIMLLLILSSSVVLGFPSTQQLPEKIRQYQAATGVSETELVSIYQNSLKRNNSLNGTDSLETNAKTIDRTYQPLETADGK